MGAIDPAVFAQHTDAKLRVWFSDGVNGFQQLSPDRPFASVPYAFNSESGSLRILLKETAKTADCQWCSSGRCDYQADSGRCDYQCSEFPTPAYLLSTYRHKRHHWHESSFY